MLLTDSKFEPVTSGLKNYLTRINHAYFDKPSSERDQCFQPTQENIETLKLIDNIMFKIGVQSYSNINRIIYFYIDMSKEKSTEKFQPEKIVNDEIEFTLGTANTRNTTLT